LCPSLSVRRFEGLEDPQVGELDSRLKTILFESLPFLHFVGPRNVFVARCFAVEVCDGLYSHLRGDFATGMAAHAIGHHVEILVLQNEEIVFVVRSLHADMRISGVSNFESHERRPFEVVWVCCSAFH